MSENQENQNETQNQQQQKGTGLINLGNTCYLNTALQILAVIPELNPSYKKSPLKKQIETSPLIASWNELYQILNQTNPTGTSVNPAPLIHNIIEHSKSKPPFLLNQREPQDSTEFIQFLIEEFHSILEKPVEVTIKGESQNPTDEIAKICYQKLAEIYQKSFSDIHRLFYGLQVSTLYPLPSLTSVSTTTLTPLSIRPETYFIVDLPLPPCPPYVPDQPVTLENCFDQLVTSEILDGTNSWFDETAGYKRPVRKQLSFWNFPPILVLTINRNQYNGAKDPRVVKFPLQGLHLSKYVHGYNKDKYIYDLMGVCLHHGNLGGGHYTSIVRKGNTNWVHYNDQMVQPLPTFPENTPEHIIQQELEKILHNPAVYCLVYRKIIST